MATFASQYTVGDNVWCIIKYKRHRENAGFMWWHGIVIGVGNDYVELELNNAMKPNCTGSIFKARDIKKCV